MRELVFIFSKSVCFMGRRKSIFGRVQVLADHDFHLNGMKVKTFFGSSSNNFRNFFGHRICVCSIKINDLDFFSGD